VTEHSPPGESAKDEKDERDEIDRLLARGRLGAPSRERVLARVLEAAEPRPSRGRFWAGLMAFASAAALAAAIVLVHRRPDALPGDAFTAKGAGGVASARVEVSCLETGTARCALGQTLVFQVEDAPQASLLAAYAEREGSAERIWYFPSKNDPSLVPVRANAGSEVLPRGARLGPEHVPGRYVVTTILVKHEMTADALLAALARAGAGDILGRWTTPLEVTP
jgi:hypothetical protein